MNTRHALVTAILFLFVLAGGRDALAISKEEIITLAQLGISAEEIIKAIEKDRTIFSLEINDILELKNAGVPEEVIRFMLATPQRYGQAKPEEKPEEKPVDKKPAEQEKTPEEIKAEAERARLEAIRLKEEQEKARQAQIKAFAEGQLRTGMELANDGEYVQAIKHFQKFIADNDYSPDSIEYYNARYGMALAMVTAGLYRSAADLLLETVLQGPDKPFFQPAFSYLAQMRRRVEYAPPNLEQLTRFFIGNFSKKFQDSYNYFLGEFFYEGANYSLALKYLEQVSEGSWDYPRALYLTGLVQIANQMYKSAVESFQRTILSQEGKYEGTRKRVQRAGGGGAVGEAIMEASFDMRVTHLAYMALARIAYETGDYDAAIYYYHEKLPRRSLQVPIAFYESAWAYFLKGDYSRALGRFQALHSPYFAHYLFPELWILEATIYLNMCHYEGAKQSVEMFRRHVSVLGIPLNRFMQSMRTPAEYYMAILKVAQGDRTYSLPQQLLYPVLSNVEFFALYKAIRQIEFEQKKLQKSAGELGAFAEERLAMLESDRISRMNEIGIKIQQVLRTVEASLREYEVKVTEIELDLNQVEMEKIEMQTRLLLQKEQIERAVQGLIADAKRKVPVASMLEKVKKDEVYARFRGPQIDMLEDNGVPEKVLDEIREITGARWWSWREGAAAAVVGGDSLQWKFQGEYWNDELRAFRSFVKEECVR